MVLEQLEIHMQKKLIETDLTSLTTINTIWITSLNVKFKIIELLEDNIVESLDDLGFGNDFLDTTPKV